MGFLDSLKSLLSGQNTTNDAFWIYARCRRCGEVMKTRLDLKNNLSLQDDGSYLARKTMVGGNNLCFQRIEVTLIFDAGRNLIEQSAEGGELISAEAYEAAKQSV